jgi:hypothetical protein
MNYAVACRGPISCFVQRGDQEILNTWVCDIYCIYCSAEHPPSAVESRYRVENTTGNQRVHLGNSLEILAKRRFDKAPSGERLADPSAESALGSCLFAISYGFLRALRHIGIHEVR